MTRMFEAADTVVHMANPDRVTKAVDGDYDPPGPGLPDNHCYCGWYNGHGVDSGALHKGYWQRVKPGWVYGCGEFGAEGLDPVELMRRRYPKAWLPQTAEEEKQWSPNSIPGAQTGSMHYYFFETPHTLADWVERSQAHQAWATRLMTEAFRRDRRMHSFAIHLFIDNFPSGWMKAIMDCERGPKPAWFAYRDALTPLAVNLRTDRRAFFAGEPIELEAWVCNDRNDAPRDATLHYQLECDGKVLQAGSTAATIPVSGFGLSGHAAFPDARGDGAHHGHGAAGTAGRRRQGFARHGRCARRVSAREGSTCVASTWSAAATARRPNWPSRSAPSRSSTARSKPDDAILIDDLPAFAKVQTQIAQAVRDGARAVFLELPEGKHRIARNRGRGRRHAHGDCISSPGRPDIGWWRVSSRTTSSSGTMPDVDRPSPLLNVPAFHAAGWEPILLSFNAMAAGWKADGKRPLVHLSDRVWPAEPPAIPWPPSSPRRLLKRDGPK